MPRVEAHILVAQLPTAGERSVACAKVLPLVSLAQGPEALGLNRGQGPVAGPKKLGPTRAPVLFSGPHWRRVTYLVLIWTLD